MAKAIPDKSDKVVTETTTTETVDVPKKKSANPLVKIIGCGCLVVLVIIGLTGIGAVAGIQGYPRFLKWADNRGLSKILGIKKTDDGQIIVPGQREVITEESAIINAVEEASPAVVSIAISSTTFNPDSGVVNSTSEIGTGFFVDSTGIIATNQHVVSDTESEYGVITKEGEELPVETIIRDDINDIAILTVKKGDYPSLVLGDSDNLSVGQRVVAIGNPLGEFPGSVSEGIISGLKRTVTTSSGFFYRGTIRKYENVIQTDAAINPGNSGGPLLDLDATVIGINFAKTEADNISFALPISILKQRLDEYKKYGRFIKPYLGIKYQLISEEEARVYKDVVPGAFVQFVDPNSPADKAGLKRADIITKIDGEDASTNFGAIIQSKKIGEKVDLEVNRDGKTIKMSATLVEKSE